MKAETETKICCLNHDSQDDGISLILFDSRILNFQRIFFSRNHGHPSIEKISVQDKKNHANLSITKIKTQTTSSFLTHCFLQPLKNRRHFFGCSRFSRVRTIAKLSSMKSPFTFSANFFSTPSACVRNFSTRASVVFSSFRILSIDEIRMIRGIDA